MNTERLLVSATALMISAGGCSIINRFEDYDRSEAGAGGVGTPDHSESLGGAGTTSKPQNEPGVGGERAGDSGGEGNSSGTECGPGTILCGGLCVAINGSNCGQCGNVCGEGEACVDAQCSCMAPYIDCNGTCIDVTANPAHCGQCDNACVEPEPLCSKGVCTSSCGQGETACDGACVDLETSEAHCGACATSCGPDQTCESGDCTCNSPLTDCSGVCVNLELDAANCGECETECASGQCSEGSCVDVGVGGAGGNGGGDMETGGTATGGNAEAGAGTISAGAGGVGGNGGFGGEAGGGGSETGGVATGGTATGGTATGGAATGGVSAGGAATGGVSTGGVATGGVATGGVATGGTATGGAAAGGAATGGTPNSFVGGPCITSPDSTTSIQVFARGDDQQIWRAVASPSSSSGWALVDALDASALAAGDVYDLDCSTHYTGTASDTHVVAMSAMPVGRLLHAAGQGTSFSAFQQLPIVQTYSTGPSVSVYYEQYTVTVTDPPAAGEIMGLTRLDINGTTLTVFTPDAPVTETFTSGTDASWGFYGSGISILWVVAFDGQGQLQLLNHYNGPPSSRWNPIEYYTSPAGQSFQYSPGVCVRGQISALGGESRSYLVVTAGDRLWRAVNTGTGYSGWQQISDVAVQSAPDCVVAPDGSVNVVALTSTGTVLYVHGDTSGGYYEADLGAF